MVIRYFKGEPNRHIIQYRRGRVVRQGPGLAFWYLPYLTSVAAVPVVSQDAPFIFNETTRNFQEVAIQGLLTYRITRPLELAERLDFTVDPRSGAYLAADPDKLTQRVVNVVQSNTRSGVNGLTLEQALTQVKDLAGEVLGSVHGAPELEELGVVVESLHFSSVKATPEMQKALEADYREGLKRRADQAIYARRASAQDEEAKLKTSELETEVTLEHRRSELVETQAANNLALAEAEAKAEELRLDPYAAAGPQLLVGLALKEWAQNAGTVGSLTITPDMLGKVVSWLDRPSS
jgi:regulator of protease activity HflC (stomatin/prohibitin superfamily)